MRWVLLAVALAVVPAPAPADTSPPERRLYLALRVAELVPLKDSELRGFDSGFAVEGALGWRVNRHLGLELGGGRLSLDRTETGLVGGLLAVTLDEQVVAYPVIASVRLVASTEKLELYAYGGGGVYFMSGTLEASAPRLAPLTQTDSDAPFAFHLGGGAALRLGPRVLVGAEVRYFTGDTDLFLQVFHERTSFDALTLGATLLVSL